MHRLSILILLLTLCAVSPAWGQNQTDGTLNRLFEHSVKSTEEFMARFNGEEAYPGLKPGEADFRKKNLFSLLDREMDAQLKKKATVFVEKVMKSNTMLAYCDTTWFAQVECIVAYKGKERTITLTLRPECYQGTPRRWSFCGAKGICGDLLPSGKTGLLSPLSHEVNFIQMSSLFHHDLTNIQGYLANGYEMDQLTAFVTLAQTGELKYKYVTEVKFIFMQVPGYVFTVEEIGRKSDNTGWLITTFSELPDEKKSSYMRNILGMKQQ